MRKSMAEELTASTIPEEKLSECVKCLHQGVGENLQSVILYGSAASGEFHPRFSNLNLLCILREIDFSLLASLAPTVAWGAGQKHPSPLLFTQQELERSADVFAIEFLD